MSRAPISAATYGLPTGHAPARNDEAVQLSIVAAAELIALGVISVVLHRRRLANTV